MRCAFWVREGAEGDAKLYDRHEPKEIGNINFRKQKRVKLAGQVCVFPFYSYF